MVKETKSLFCLSLSLSVKAIPSSLVNDINLANTVLLYFDEAASGLHFNDNSLKVGQLALRCSI